MSLKLFNFHPKIEGNPFEVGASNGVQEARNPYQSFIECRSARQNKGGQVFIALEGPDRLGVQLSNKKRDS
jgi:hypothetical protein